MKPLVLSLALAGFIPTAVAQSGSDAQPADFPPIPVEDLRVDDVESTLSSVTLRWTAPVYQNMMMDGDFPAEAYEIYCSTDPISEETLSPDLLVPGCETLHPQAAGTDEEFLVDSLSPGVFYYFAIRSRGWYYWSLLNTNAPVGGATASLPPPPLPPPDPAADPGAGGGGCSVAGPLSPVSCLLLFFASWGCCSLVSQFSRRRYNPPS